MIIKTKDGWKDFVGPIPSEARIEWFLKAQKDGYKSEIRTRINDKEDKRKEESWLRGVYLDLHRATFPAGMHYPGSECVQDKEPQGCPFNWSAKYLAAL